MNPMDTRGKKVNIVMDRPMGFIHTQYKNIPPYPVNYGYVKEYMGGDGAYQDVYLLGVDTPISEYNGAIIIGVIIRLDDVETKWIAAPEGIFFSREEMLAQTNFVEQFFQIELYT